MKNKFIAFCAASLLGVSLSTVAIASGDDNNLTLQDAVTKGIQTHPFYGVVANDSLATREELSQAKALYKPSVDLLAESGWERTDSPTIDDESLWRNRASLTLTQLIYDGRGTISEINRQKAR
ncbi:MAG TPA: TolC family protein, partial [Alphaproteobacteria bacterium]|nr:TolC family protein [Alphaproteobacteria bacterium]